MVIARSLAFAAATILLSPVAEAHFKINMPMSWMSQDTVGGPQKNGPCAAMPNTALGDSPGTATKMMTVFQAGQTIPISVTATVAHPGWWRVALVEGASSKQTLTTLPDPMAQAGTNCTPAIMANPVWSPTQPIVADGLPAGSVATTQQKGTQTLQVKLPDNANCSNASPCTLQVIMVMTDHPKTDCYYHHCADIVLGSSADGGTTPTSDAGAASDGGRDAAGTGGSAVAGTGGAQGTGGGPGSGTGGLPGAGGVLAGTGGLSGTGGLVGSGGTTGSGGTFASSGGAGPSFPSTGGAPGSGSGGAATTNQSGSGSGGGCRVASGGESSSAGVGAAGLAALALMLRRRRPRS
jgi:MYXO-CTERM domain-containing protein